jgi:hypothetical protein
LISASSYASSSASYASLANYSLFFGLLQISLASSSSDNPSLLSYTDSVSMALSNSISPFYLFFPPLVLALTFFSLSLPSEP